MRIALALLLGACNLAGPPRDRIVFAHGPHVADGQSCTLCHARAALADAGVTDVDRPLLPREADCRSCHSDAERDRCNRCHSEPARAQTYADRTDDVIFDHSAHADATQGRCVRCHGAGGASAQAFEPVRPPMATCTNGCHREDMQALRCTRCHRDLHSYRIDQVALIEHPPGFVRRHGTIADVDSSLCTQCHEPSFCEECHQSAPGAPLEAWMPSQAFRDFVHRGDFLARHGTEADLERGTCARCHGTPFCDGCHRESGVGGGVAPASPHPPGWLDPLSSFGHAQAARRDLMSCVSCHEADAERTCVPCHRVGGVAPNPHPPGFGSGAIPTQIGVCRACHAP